ncbi:YodC family protein [Spirosoma areae]
MKKFDLQPGDTVQLKSGGPVMTVIQYVNEIDNFLCQWFVGGKLEKEQFPAPVLVKTQIGGNLGL